MSVKNTTFGTESPDIWDIIDVVEAIAECVLHHPSTITLDMYA